MYRIISGRWKGRKISAPKNFKVRPVTDFAKEALFSIFNNHFTFEEVSVLDLFAGIGSISLEFASRSCKDVTAIDINRRHCRFIEETAEKLELSQAIKIINYDVFKWLEKSHSTKAYHIIFADPPYDFSDTEYQTLIHAILEGDLLKDQGLFILEHQSKREMNHPTLQQTRSYGNVSFSFFNKQ